MKKEGNNLEGMPSAENSINFTEKTKPKFELKQEHWDKNDYSISLFCDDKLVEFSEWYFVSKTKPLIKKPNK